jgi:BMFP domain-containing protein YqiC
MFKDGSFTIYMNPEGVNGPFRMECELPQYMSAGELRRYHERRSPNVNWERLIRADDVQLRIKDAVFLVLSKHLSKSEMANANEFAGTLSTYFAIVLFSQLGDTLNTSFPAIMHEIDRRITVQIQKWLPDFELTEPEIIERCARIMDGHKELLALLSRVIRTLETKKNQEESRKPWSDIYNVYNLKTLYDSKGNCRIIIQGLMPDKVDRNEDIAPRARDWLVVLEKTREKVEKGLNWMRELSERDMSDEDRGRLSFQVEADVKSIEIILADIINDDDELKAVDKLYDDQAHNNYILQTLEKHRRTRDMELVSAICGILMRPG